MSILNPDGTPVNGGGSRPSNDATLKFIKEQQAQQQANEAEALVDNIVHLGEAGQSAELLERRRKQITAAARVMGSVIEADARMFEELALNAKDITFQDRFNYMDRARCFRVTLSHIAGLVATMEKQASGTAGGNPS